MHLSLCEKRQSDAEGFTVLTDEVKRWNLFLHCLKVFLTWGVIDRKITDPGLQAY